MLKRFQNFPVLGLPRVALTRWLSNCHVCQSCRGNRHSSTRRNPETPQHFEKISARNVKLRYCLYCFNEFLRTSLLMILQSDSLRRQEENPTRT